MTTLNNDELRAGLVGIVGQHLAKWRGTTPLEDYANVDDVYRTLTPELEEYVTQLIATHDQQLLEAILAGAEPNPTTPAGENEFIPVEHIKSVFKKEGSNENSTDIP